MASASIPAALWDSRAVFFRPEEPFTWASGIKSPIYCDNRLLISRPDVRSAISDAFVELIRPMAPQVIAGTATAGIPWAAWIAERLQLPMVYVRSLAKSHGRQNLIEGELTPGQSVVLVEDLISTGKSSLAAVDALREAGGKVLAVTGLFHYNFPQAHDVFTRHQVPCHTLCTLDDMLAWAVTDGKMASQTAEDIRTWRQNVSFP
jgi:orotate phosphoribosyltransferase